MHVKQPFCSGALMQVIDILRDNQEVAWPFGIEPRQRQMRRIGLDYVQLCTSCIVEFVDQPRIAGEGWRDAITIGVLMNARGLMELIILNIGLERGVITPTLFTIMVVMAVVTTLMASPLFELVYGRRVVPAGAAIRAG